MEDIQTRADNVKTGKKNMIYKNESGEVLWTVTVIGTFTYNGKTSRCTSSNVSAISKKSDWKITSKSHSKYDNKATAKATAQKYFLGFSISTVNKTVTLSCDKQGNLF